MEFLDKIHWRFSGRILDKEGQLRDLLLLKI